MKLAAAFEALFAAQRCEPRGAVGGFYLASADAPRTLSSWWGAVHALSLRRLDPSAGLQELRTLYAALQREDGHVAYDRLFEAVQGEPLAGTRTKEGASALIAPPLAAYAVACFVLDGADARDLLECATRQLDSIWSERLPPDTSLPVILHPCESATWGSPQFDSLVESTDVEEWRSEASNLARSAAACMFDPERALRVGHAFVVEDPVFCGWFLVALEEVRLAWEKLGDETAIAKLRIRSEMLAEAISDRLWSEPLEIFCPRDRGHDALLDGVCAAGLVPAASRLLLEEGPAKRAIERHLRASGTPLWCASGISFNPFEAGIEPDEERIPWRDNTAPAIAQFWTHLALTRAGRAADAQVLRKQFEARVTEHGPREFYEPQTGAPLQTGHATAAALLLAMEP